MQIEISQYSHYLVIAGPVDNLKRYKVKGDKIQDVFAQFDRVVYMGKLEGFETYVKNPETGEGGWDIVFIEGVKEAIQKYYPHFDTFITKDYPTDINGMVKFYQLERDDYDMAAFTTDGNDEMTDERINDLFDTLIDSDIHTTIDYIISKNNSQTYEGLITRYDERA